MANRLGCLLFLVLFGWMAVEVWVGMLIGEAFDHEYFGVLIVAIVLTIVGIQQLRRRIQTLPQAMMDGSIGRRAVGIFGAIMLAIPGFITDTLGILLLLPPLQIAFASFAAKVFQQMAQRAAQQMAGKGFPGGFPGGAGGFPGGAGGFPGGGFPGGAGGFPGGGFPSMKPDDSWPTKRKKASVKAK